MSPIGLKKLKNKCKFLRTSPRISNYANSISRPFFKTESVPPKDQDLFTQALCNNSLINQISDQIKALDLQTRFTSYLDRTCVLADTDTSTSENDADDLNESEEESLNVISKVFKDETTLVVTKLDSGILAYLGIFIPGNGAMSLQVSEPEGTGSGNRTTIN